MNEAEDARGTGARSPSGRRRSAHTHEAILGATMDLLAEVGYQALSIERVAMRAGVGKATIYRWWPGKSALVLEAIQSRAPFAQVAPTGDPRTDLRAVIQAAADAYTTDVVGATLPALASDISEDSSLAGLLWQFLRPQRDTARQILHQAAAAGDIPADVDIELVIDLCVGTVFYRALVGGNSVDEVMVEQLTSLVVDNRLPRTTRVFGEGSGRPHPVHSGPAVRRGRPSQPAVASGSRVSAT